MCWKSESIPRIMVAEEDISVFKVLHPDMTSMYAGFVYALNITYSTELDIPRGKYVMQSGFHSYTYDVTLKWNHGRLDIDDLMGIRLDYFFTRAIRANCIIPEGSKYAVNERGEVISEKIKVIDVSYI